MTKGFTLLELLIVLSVVGVFLILTGQAFVEFKERHSQNGVTATDVNYYDTKVKQAYIDNNKRSYDVVTLKRHSDGQLYACDTDNVCKRVVQ